MVSPEEDAKYVGENVGKSQSGMSKFRDIYTYQHQERLVHL